MNTKSALTKRQSDVLYFIRTCIREQKIPPSIKEICTHFGFASTNAVYEILRALEMKGHIRRGAKGSSRSIVVLGEEKQEKSPAADVSHIKHLTLIGEGSAENPLSVFLQPRGQVSVDSRHFALGKQQFFAALAPDSAMSAEGIMAGDTLIVQQSSNAQDNDLVLALMNDETILRRYHKKGKEAELSAAAKGFPKIKAGSNDDSVVIIGVVKASMRKL